MNNLNNTNKKNNLTLYYNVDKIKNVNTIDYLNWESSDALIGYSYGSFPDVDGEALTLIPTLNLSNKPVLDNKSQGWESVESDFLRKIGEGYFIYAHNAMKWSNNPQFIN